jgi:putative nucleotidyltransferase with HDIG domain
MKLTLTFLHSKVAYRIFILFIICALIPIIALAVLSFSQVTQQLNEQSRTRLRHATKATGMAIYERLLTLEGEMKLFSSHMVLGPRAANPTLPHDISENLTARFKGLALITETEKQVPYFGHIQNSPRLTAPEKDYIRSGQTLVTSQSNSDLPARIFMSRALDPKNPKRGFLLGEINIIYLWDLDEETSLPVMTELCVLDHSKNVLYCSPELAPSIPQQVAASMRLSSVGQLNLEHEGQEYIVSYWSIFLQPKFFRPKWTVVLTESKSDALSPMAHFTKIFPLVTLMSLLVVLLLSIIQIRRSLIPLGKLKEGTRRITNRDFDSRVTVRSGDEFEELATSFNMMASRLGKQFKTLTSIAEIDRQILSTLDTRKIVNTLLTRLPDVFPCDCISVTLIGPNGPDVGRIYIRENKPGSEIQVETIQLPPKVMEKFYDHQDNFLITDEGVPEYLPSLAKLGIKSFLVLPIFIKDRLSAIIRLGYLTLPAFIQEDLDQARQLVDQMAVALSNATLIEELNQLNWGTLTALARTIDAKSPWTAGHSERVTKLALKIGKVLGFGPKEMEVLQRGGLLHDTGKIGTPAEILDKPGKLTNEEIRLMREHVLIGARILEPIAAYADVIPIVLQHHEWFNGTGYPYGISGEAINLGARIFAVADYFDALTSDRPYRHVMDRKRVIELIKQEAGRQFDPKVVQAFVEVMAQEEGET